MAKGKNTAGRPLAAKAAVAALLFLTLQGTVRGCGRTTESGTADKEGSLWGGMLQEMADAGTVSLYSTFMPCILLETADSRGGWFFREQIGSLFPLYEYAEGIPGREVREQAPLREILLAEAREPSVEEEWEERSGVEMIQEREEASLAELLAAENEAALVVRESAPLFAPHTQQAQVELEPLRDYETLVRQFYIVDANTAASSDRLDVESFLSKDMTISKEDGEPQILIYHTHSREAFADSLPGDASTTIVGVGERLAQILRDTYGYGVLHHTEEYDTDRDQAYSKALPQIEKILEENPSIQVVIDLHRDEMPEGTRLVMDLDGRPTARFMFFNGLSRTKTTGDITYLYNENLDDNLAFSFQMQKKAVEYYPGLTRKIYLKGYRYNMHLKDKYLLVELGAQNNTVEEAMNACGPLAHILDMVLSGS